MNQRLVAGFRRLNASLATLQWAYQNVWKHPSNRGARFSGLIRFTIFQIRGKLFHLRTPVPIGIRSRLLCDVRFGATWRAAMGNPPNVEPMAAWRRLLEPGSLFVDGGANVGTYTIFALDLGARVIAIEPNEEARQLLSENLELNGYDATVLACALSDEPGTVRFTTDLEQSNHIADQGVEVEARTLDEIIGDEVVSGVKLDIEGAELLALKGATRLLSEGRVKAVQLEWSEVSQTTFGQDRQPLADLLLSYGYEICRPDADGGFRRVDTFGFQRDLFAIAPDVKARLLELS